MRDISIGIFGGSFDPIHEGHLKLAQEIQSRIGFDHFFFLPCGQPALKPKFHASAMARYSMLKLALDDYPQFELSEDEIWQTETSYTQDTLAKLRAKWGKTTSISFILGDDAMASLMAWKQWDQILNYSHLIYYRRPLLPTRFSAELRRYIQDHLAVNHRQLKKQASGLICSLEVKDYPYSSTKIRHDLEQNHPVHGLCPKVLDYIQAHHLYKNAIL